MCYVNDILFILIDGFYENHTITYRYLKKVKISITGHSFHGIANDGKYTHVRIKYKWNKL